MAKMQRIWWLPYYGSFPENDMKGNMPSYSSHFSDPGMRPTLTIHAQDHHILSGHKYPAEHEPQLLISTHTPGPREAFSFVQSSSNMSYLLGLGGSQPSPGRITGGHAQKFGFSLSHAYLAHECYLWKWNLVSYGSAEQIQNQKNSPAQQASPSLWEWIMTLNDTAQI